MLENGEVGWGQKGKEICTQLIINGALQIEQTARVIEFARTQFGCRFPRRLKPSILRHGLMNGLIAFPNENHTLGNRFLHQNGTVGQELRKKNLICH